MYDHGMTHAFNASAVAKAAPHQLSVTELRSKMSDVLDDARVGYVTYVERGSRLVAAVVPVGVGQAYEAGADSRRAARDEIASDVWTAIGAITDALSELLDRVEDPAAKQAAAEHMYQRFAARHRSQDDTADDGTESTGSDEQETEAGGATE